MYLNKVVALAAVLLFVLFADGQNKPDSISSDFSITKDTVKIEARYPGGNSAWQKFLEKKIDSYTPAIYDAPVGKYTVEVRFIIDKSGEVTGIEPVTNMGYGMENELIRVIKKSQTWIPATINGIPAKAYRKQPITFFVETTDFKISSKVPYVLFTETDNEIAVDARKIKPENLSITISEGSITPGANGNYIIQVSRPGRVMIELFDTKRKNKKIGSASFEVKPKNEK